MVSLIEKVTGALGRHDADTRELLGGTAVALLAKVGGGVLGFSVNVLLARLLGVEGVGLYFLGLSYVTLAATVGRVGLDQSVVRFTAAHVAEGDWEGVRSVYRRGMQAATGALLFIGVTTAACAPWLADRLLGQPEAAGVLRIMSFAGIAYGLMLVQAGALRGVKQIGSSQLVQDVMVPACMLALLPLLVYRLGAEGAAAAYGVATAASLAVGAFLWRRMLPSQARSPRAHGSDGFLGEGLLGSGVPLLGVALATAFINTFPTFALGHWSTAEDVGVFNVVLRTTLLAGFVLMAVNAVAAPKFAELYRRGDTDALRRVARGSAKLTALLTLPLVALCLAIPGPILSLFGADFVAGAGCLRVMALGYFVNVSTGSVGHLLAMSGRERIMGAVYAGAALVTVGLCVVLVPPMGLLGAGAAMATGLALQNVAAAYAVWRLHGISAFFFLPQPEPVLASHERH